MRSPVVLISTLWLLTLLVVPAAVGKEAPVTLDPLRLPTIDGKQTIDLAALRGKKLLLIEFASW